MTTILILMANVIIGVALGARFKVLVLLPASMASIMLATGAAAARGNGLGMIMATAALCVTALQAGYLLGTATRFFVVPRVRPRPHRPTAAAPVR